MIHTFKYRVYPSKRQEVTLNKHLAICCELYNAALQERRDAWRLERKSISYFEQTYQLVQIKSERADVADVAAFALMDALKRVDQTFKAFFRRVRAGRTPGYPRFRSVQRFDSFTLRQIGDALQGTRLRIMRVGFVKIKLSRPIEGTIKTLTIKREAGRWYALFACDVQPQPLPLNANSIGVDVGLSAFATLSNGVVIENPRWYRITQAKLRIAQRKVVRRKKGSNRRRKAIQILQRAHIMIRNQRSDFHHKLSRTLVNKNGLIAAEDLNVKGLAGGMLSKSVSDAGWTQFLNMVAYKAESAGRVFVRVNPSGTSQTCTCGAEVRKTLADRWHLCLSCGLSAARDHVSAQIILARAEAQPSGANVGSPCVA